MIFLIKLKIKTSFGTIKNGEISQTRYIIIIAIYHNVEFCNNILKLNIFFSKINTHDILIPDMAPQIKVIIVQSPPRHKTVRYDSDDLRLYTENANTFQMKIEVHELILVLEFQIRLLIKNILLNYYNTYKVIVCKLNLIALS